MVVNSIFFIISFGLLVTALVLMPRTKNELRIIQECMISIIFVLCYGTVAAGVINALHIPINLLSMGMVYLIPTILLLGKIILKRKHQKLIIGKAEIISVAILFFIWLLIELKTYSYEMRASYGYNTDVGNHLGMALSIVRRENVGGMYFAALFNAMIMEIFQPFFQGIKIYKGFVFAECIHSLFELIFYYSIIYGITKKKYAAPILSILLWAGWPLFNFISGGYVYWGWGVLLLVFVVYNLEQALEETDNPIYCMIKALFGLAGVIFCYNLFAPLAAIFFVVFGVMEWRKRKLKLSKKLIAGLSVAFIFCAAVAGYVYNTFFIRGGIDIFEQLKVHGGHFGPHIFGDFIWFLPITIIFYYHCFKKDIKPHIYGVVYLVSWIFQICLLVAYEFRLISDYYYFKFYYPLWVLMWMVIALAVENVPVEKKEYKYWGAYIATFALVFINAFGFVPEVINGITDNWLTRESDLGTQVYYMNARQLARDYEDLKYSTYQLELCEQAMEINQETGENVVFSYWWDIGGQNNWYIALTGLGTTFTMDLATLRDECDWQSRIESFSYYVMLKETELYKNNKQYFDEQNWVYENEEGFIVQVQK